MVHSDCSRSSWNFTSTHSNAQSPDKVQDINTCLGTRQWLWKRGWNTKVTTDWDTIDASAKIQLLPQILAGQKLTLHSEKRHLLVKQRHLHNCKHCFSLTHNAEECDWTPTPYRSTSQQRHTSMYVSALRACYAKVCYEWNHNPSLVCQGTYSWILYHMYSSIFVMTCSW